MECCRTHAEELLMTQKLYFSFSNLLFSQRQVFFITSDGEIQTAATTNTSIHRYQTMDKFFSAFVKYYRRTLPQNNISWKHVKPGVFW